MALTWTRKHSLRITVPEGAPVTTEMSESIKAIPGVAGCDSTDKVMTVGFAQQFDPTALRRGPYRQLRRVLITYGIITSRDRATIQRDRVALAG